ncbi:hypothetical protein [Gloeobacter violaceus]|nr:hypothetical protein [Gloeobacter violaceus]
MRSIKAKPFALPVLLVEIFSIVVSILLALGIDELRENAKNRQLVDKALKNIRKEVLNNRKNLQKDFVAHEALLSGLNKLVDLNATKVDSDKLLSPKVVTLKELVDTLNDKKVRGLPYTEFDSIAWRTAQASQAVAHMDYETRLLVANVYETQEKALDFRNRCGSNLVNQYALGQKNLYYSIFAAIPYCNNFVSNERQLLKYSNNLLEEIK